MTLVWDKPKQSNADIAYNVYYMCICTRANLQMWSYLLNAEH